jgi:hypothetical protein
MPIPDVRDYIALGLMAPEPVDNDAACPYCERTEGHEADCSEAADFTPHYRDYYSATYRYDYEEDRR